MYSYPASTLPKPVKEQLEDVISFLQYVVENKTQEQLSEKPERTLETAKAMLKDIKLG